jgi:hypothetical protein
MELLPDKETLGQISFQYLGFSLSVIILPFLNDFSLTWGYWSGPICGLSTKALHCKDGYTSQTHLHIMNGAL